MNTLPKSTFDISKINGPYALLGAFLLIFESILVFWIFRAEGSIERISAGLLATVNLMAFLLVVIRITNKKPEMPPHNALLDSLCGKWEYHSVSITGAKRDGTCTIKKQDGQLVVTGNYKKDGARVGSWHSEMTRVRDNRLIFYYILRDTSHEDAETVDAVTILIFDPDDPTTMEGDWIVVGKDKKHGRVDYKRIES